MKLLLIFAVICLSVVFGFEGQRYKVDINRRPILERLAAKNGSKHFRHDPDDYQYLTVSIQLGAPSPWDVKFGIDTTHGDLQVTLCQNDDSNGLCYDGSQSQDFKVINKNVASDTIQDVFGNETTVVFSTDKQFSNSVGSAGLGFPASSKYPGVTNFPLAFLTGSDKVFSIERSYDASDIELVFGGHVCQESPKSTVYVPTSSKSYWQFPMAGVNLGGVTYTKPSQAVIDMRTEYIGIPRQFLNEFADKFHIHWNDTVGAYTVDCSRRYSLPALQFNVGDHLLQILAQDYVYWQEPLPGTSTCVLDFEDSETYGFGPAWYFGIQIITDYCVSFDFKQNRLGFTANPNYYGEE